MVETQDGDGKINLEFKDKLGHVILKRFVINNSTFADTYYVYDDFELLRYVISPEGVPQIPSSFNANTEIAQKYIYCYKYDEHRRLIEKQIPGKSVEYFVYDKSDRVIMFQDGNMRKFKPDPSGIPGSTVAAFEWLFTKYDAFGQVIMTGITTKYPTKSRIELQVLADAAVFHWEYVSYNGNYPASKNNYYTNRTFPLIEEEYCNILKIYYYDEYNVFIRNGKWCHHSTYSQ